MTPVEELRAAAAKIREMVRGTTATPWVACWDAQIGGAAVSQHEHIQADGGSEYPLADLVKDADAKWIALMGPDKAYPIAALLEHYAESVAWSDNWDDVRNCGKPIKQFARSILGEAS